MRSPLITIFNGREIQLGEGDTPRIYLQVDVHLRDLLYLLKGAKLAVFLAVAFHSNSRGWSWPSRRRIAKETGYTEDTVSSMLTELCKMEIEGNRLLLRYQPNRNGIFSTNMYLIFPTDADLAQFEHSQPALPQLDVQPPCSDLPCTVGPCTVQPCTVQPCTVTPCTLNDPTNHNHALKDNHDKLEPEQKEEPAASKQAAAAPIFCSIHHAPMTRREKDGDVWYSHQTKAGVWCKGAPGDQPDDATHDPCRTSLESRRKYLQWNDPQARHRYVEGEFAEYIQH